MAVLGISLAFSTVTAVKKVLKNSANLTSSEMRSPALTHLWLETRFVIVINNAYSLNS